MKPVLKFFITILVIAGFVYGIVSLVNYSKQNVRKAQFTADTTRIFSLTKINVYEPEEIVDVQKRFDYNAKQYQYTHAQIELVSSFLSALPIRVEVGEIYWDEFSNEMIEVKTEYLSMPFKNYLQNKDSLIIRNINQGFENANNKRAFELYKKYDWEKNFCLLAAMRQIQIGMTDEMCRVSWGTPEDINKTVGSWGVHEQWVYGSGYYVYFENGILTSWQN